jgi:Predicted dehydrogenases and related proteins
MNEVKMQSKEKKIRFAVVGYGHIGRRHAEMILRNPEAELVAICDILPADKVNADRNIPFFSNLHDLLKAGIEIDVLTICTPNGLHASMALMGLRSGLHVVVEKPMTLQRSEAEEILNIAREKKRCVFCVMQNRYSPPSLWIKEMVESGRLGKLFLIKIDCFWNRDARYYVKDGWHGTKELDGGTLFTQFSHFIDIMYWLFGDIDDINASFANFNHKELIEFEDSGIISFKFQKGGMGVFNYSTSVRERNFESSMTIIAEKGTIKIGGQYMNEVEYCEVEDYVFSDLPPTNPGNDYGSYKGSAQNHHYVIENVIRVLNGEAEISVNPEDGMKVVDIIERIYALKKKEK